MQSMIKIKYMQGRKYFFHNKNKSGIMGKQEIALKERGR